MCARNKQVGVVELKYLYSVEYQGAFFCEDCDFIKMERDLSI